jgi:CopA family copper-resistance protein
LLIAKASFSIAGRVAAVTAINGSLPGPLLRFREGDTATLRITNRLDENTSLHWHGVLVPAGMDGVPGVSFSGIKPGETFTYRFPVRQNGTYWYHSHSGMQEPSGVYGPLIIDPAEQEPFAYDRDYVVMLSDWSFEDPHRILAKLKEDSAYYNFQKRTLADFFRDAARRGWAATVSDRLAWGRMRMDPTDIADVTGYTYTYLINGMAPADNWTALFAPGERVRLRFINGAAMSYFDVRIPGLKMTVVQADGQNVRPTTVDEFRIAAGETYDVIVEPREDRAYTLFAEAMDRSGYARATLAPRDGMSGPLSERRPRPLRTMADMGMDGNRGMPSASSEAGDTAGAMPGMDMSAMLQGAQGGRDDAAMMMHGPDHHGPGNAMVAMMPVNRLDEPGTGLERGGARVLVYADLRNVEPGYDERIPGREIELHITGNMERYMWSFDGKEYAEAREPIPFTYGERLRITFVNDTMMDHPIHLHGMWMELDNGAGAHRPRKHTVSVKPGERLSVMVTANAPGKWAFHCHLFYHMVLGMFRVVSVSDRPAGPHP